MGGAANKLASATVGLALVSAAGCQFVAGLRRPDRDAGSDAADVPDTSTAPVRSADPCDESTLTQPSADTDGKKREPIELVFNYVEIEQRANDAGAAVCAKTGFRLDDAGCYPAYDDGGAHDAGNCRTACRPLDAGREVDNAAGEVLGNILDIPIARSFDIDPVTSLEIGAANVMIRIENYDWQADDPDVDLELFALSGLMAESRPLVDAAAADGSDGVGADSWSRPWDRHSYRQWSVDPTCLAPDVALMRSLYFGKGYVRDHVLVAHAAQMPASFSRLPIVLGQATIVGELHPNDGHWTMDHGRIGGDVRVADLEAQLPALAARVDCTGIVQPLFKTVCDARDRGIGGVCDALSVGLSFTMVEGGLGLPQEQPAVPLPSPCELQCP